MKPSLQTSDYRLWLFPRGVKRQDGQATAAGQGGSRMCALASWALVGFHWWLGCCSRCDEPGGDPFQLIAQGSLGCCRETVCLHLIFKHSPDVFVCFAYIHAYISGFVYAHVYKHTGISYNLKFGETVITASQVECYQPTLLSTGLSWANW